MGDPEVQVSDNEQEQRFEVRVDGELAGYAVYQRDGNVTSFVHTKIESAFEGRGVGSALARSALDGTRASGNLAVPVCPFIRHFIQTHPEYREMVPPHRRAEFGLD